MLGPEFAIERICVEAFEATKYERDEHDNDIDNDDDNDNDNDNNNNNDMKIRISTATPEAHKKAALIRACPTQRDNDATTQIPTLPHPSLKQSRPDRTEQTNR